MFFFSYIKFQLVLVPKHNTIFYICVDLNFKTLDFSLLYVFSTKRGTERCCHHSDQKLRSRAALSLHLDLQGLQGGLQVIQRRAGAQHLRLRLRHLADVVLQGEDFKKRTDRMVCFNFIVAT